ncbi:MAG: hypothetical protein JWM26_4714 [Betaproteobacteria bacterium]|nr:hypothetical protein [Betaproteobacteria bacterium]
MGDAAIPWRTAASTSASGLLRHIVPRNDRQVLLIFLTSSSSSSFGTSGSPALSTFL